MDGYPSLCIRGREGAILGSSPKIGLQPFDVELKLSSLRLHNPLENLIMMNSGDISRRFKSTGDTAATALRLIANSEVVWT